jgi:hypothetical protein
VFIYELCPLWIKGWRPRLLHQTADIPRGFISGHFTFHTIVAPIDHIRAIAFGHVAAHPGSDLSMRANSMLHHIKIAHPNCFLPICAALCKDEFMAQFEWDVPAAGVRRRGTLEFRGRLHSLLIGIDSILRRCSLCFPKRHFNWLCPSIS